MTRNRPQQPPGAGASGGRLWSGIEELADDPAFQAFLDAEYPAAADFSPTARREFLKLMGASFALAGLAGCEKSPFVAALPYVNQPDNETIGLPRYYATAVMLDGFAQPVVATTFAGRPTKLDGNADHPMTQGRSDVFMQAAVLGLYDPDRAQGPSRRGEPASWKEVEAAVVALRSRWAAAQGDGLRLLTSPITSPTLLRQIDALIGQFPKARVHLHDATGIASRRDLTMAAYGQPLDLHYRLDACDIVISFDDDFLGPGPNQVRNAHGWSTARRRFADRPGLKLHMAESVPSATGAMAGARLIADSSRMPLLAQALARELGIATAALPDLTSEEQSWIKRAAAACLGAKDRALVVSSPFGEAVTAGWTARINDHLKSAGRALLLTAPVSGPANAGTLKELVADISAGRVDSLVIVDANPVYSAPAALGFADGLRQVRTSLHLGLQRDESGALCEWQLPLTHALESWSDGRAVDGTATIIQPTVTPFYDVRSAHQIFGMMLGEINPAADSAVRETWRSILSDNFDVRWRRALRDGFVEGAANPVEAKPIAAADLPTTATAKGLDVVFRPDPTVWDGTFANIGWLQELPKPLTTLTWGNVVAISAALAKRLVASNGDRVEVTIGNRHVTGPVWIMPGQAENTIALYLGHGRTGAGRVGNGVGYDAYRARPPDQLWLAKASLRKVGSAETLAVTQMHHRMEGFDFVREVSASHPELERAEAEPSLYPSWPSARNAWGMVIDLDVCIGCNACVAACTAENNVPVVGKEQVEAGREMHWIRVARYYEGEIERPRSFFQPVPCMHCEQAPCEMGCPVHATTHSPEGVNQMIYNRCIGTRTCSSFCPYKVRRFNFYDYRAPPDSPAHAAHNPEVTVRSRGVMEKCTYCTQRIEAAHAAADKENRPLRDGDVVTACQQACPTRAIVFGDINDPESEVSRARREGRNYTLLEELGTRPRTSYLARFRDGGDDQG
ncbi:MULTISPECIES: TAT-variant-translocated molybdopterin oxidoreductase [unclassified Bradyrhizobium]